MDVPFLTNTQYVFYGSKLDIQENVTNQTMNLFYNYLKEPYYVLGYFNSCIFGIEKYKRRIMQI